ncbi:hypothetical protein GQ457_17G000020 [Hibiscus cannabinus]
MLIHVSLMDKTWINLRSRASEEYIRGVTNFLNFAFERTEDGKIWCPCVNCVNTYRVSRRDAFDHLICDGFLKGYVRWIFHGERCDGSIPPTPTNVEEREFEHDIHNILHDMMAERVMNNDERHGQSVDPSTKLGDHNHRLQGDKFYGLLKDSEVPLYPNCKKFSKLSFIIYLFHIKCFNGWTNKSFNSLLEVLKLALPDDNTLPGSYHEMKKIIRDLGLGYEKIHACPNDCMLFWKENENGEVCLKCGASRWKGSSNGVEDEDVETSSKKKKQAAKILRWFPLIPRLQRLFLSSKIAPLMTWHEDSRKKDGRMRHPADSLAWKSFDSQYPEFSSDPRNIRLGLASDGFNPFRTLSVAHSTWPVIIIPYNLPPWICMKQSNFILSLLISGPKGPGNNIDVYMQPLVAELHELWEVGVETFDAATNKTFQLRAALMWTINDFPAYANLSGWSTRGEYACPCCGYSTASKWLKHSRKFCYMCHRRWLEPNHRFRTDKHSFDGTEEYRIAPSPPTGTDVLRQLEALNGIVDGPWKKKSIFFSLPYWEHQLLRHNLDVMHIEKNICDNILGTLIGQEGKNKDTYKSRLDLVEMGIRSVLHPQTRTGRSTLYLPQASYQMTTSEKNSFLKVLKEMKTPDEYSSNVSRCVHLKQRKLLGLKSYDCHLLMQEFLPIAIRGTLPEKVCIVLIALCNFFKDLCSKVLEESEVERLELKAALILCDLEKIFPPSFFTIMMHLLIHLANEAKIGGPVSYRWMYPVERAHPEGSIAEGYLSHECLTFCSRYLEGIETVFNGLGRNNDGENSYIGSEVTIFSTIGRPLGRKKPSVFHVKKRKRVSRLVLDEQGLAQAHRYVLFNSDEVSPYIKKQEQEIKRRNRRKRFSPFEIHKLQSETFHTWFRDYVALLDRQEDTSVVEVVKWLARGPTEVVKRYSGYIINGFRYHTTRREKNLKTQNSGVVVTSKTWSYASARDKQPVEGEVNYYGALKDIVELNYSGRFKVVLFKCDWVDINRGCKKDKFGFTLVNFSHLAHRGNNLIDDPYVLASQVKKVYFVKDERLHGWLTVKHAKLRDLFDMGDASSFEKDEEPEQLGFDDSVDTSISSWIRNDVGADGFDVTPDMENENAEEDPINEQNIEAIF